MLVFLLFCYLKTFGAEDNFYNSFASRLLPVDTLVLCCSPNKKGMVSNGQHAISPTTSLDDGAKHTNMSSLL